MRKLWSTFMRPMLLALALILSGCARENLDCEGPLLDLAGLNALRGKSFTQGPVSSLILPNPIDVSQAGGLTSTQLNFALLARDVSLPVLNLTSTLDGGLIRVRRTSTNDPIGQLASPNSNGDWIFDFETHQYSQTMGYYGTQTQKEYLEGLGFEMDESRPLYILVEAEGSTGFGEDAGAFYSHNALSSNEPRVISVFGNGSYAPGKDLDVFRHEFGHFVNESISGGTGIDLSGDLLAYYSEGGAIHECLADYGAQSISNRHYIGKWVAQNFESIPPGNPLRSAIDYEGNTLDFFKMSQAITEGDSPDLPDVHGVGEWCSRVLWDIRKQILAESPKYGALFADRMILSAASILPRDASFQDFRRALVTADENLACGQHKKTIKQAFETRGFDTEPEQLDQNLTLKVEPISFQRDGTSIVSTAAGTDVSFYLSISNPNDQVARNVRVFFKSHHSGLKVMTYMQSFGELAPGETLVIDPSLVNTAGGGTTDYSVGFYASPYGQISESWGGEGLGYTIYLVVENAPVSQVQGVIQ